MVVQIDLTIESSSRKFPLYSFEKRPSDIEWVKKTEKIEGFVGHPPYIDWFCSKHYDKANELKNLTIDKAMKILKS